MRSNEYLLVFGPAGGRRSGLVKVVESMWMDAMNAKPFIPKPRREHWCVNVSPHHFGPGHQFGTVETFGTVHFNAWQFRIAYRLAMAFLNWKEPKDVFRLYGKLQATAWHHQDFDYGVPEFPIVPEFICQVNDWGNQVQRPHPFNRHAAVYSGFFRKADKARRRVARERDEIRARMAEIEAEHAGPPVTVKPYPLVTMETGEHDSG